METKSPRFDWSMVFYAVVTQGGFTAAAESLGLSKAYVSKQLSQLEQSLGVTLLHRSTRRSVLTEAGQQYFAYCQRLHATMTEASRAMSHWRQEVSGRIRLSAPTSLGVAYLGDLLLAFQQQYPLIELDLDLSQDTRDLIAEQYDLALRVGTVVDERLVALPIGTLQEWIVAAPEIIRRYGVPSQPADLQALPTVISSHNRAGGVWQFSLGSHSQSVELKRRFCVNSYTALRHLALAGAGYIKVPDYLVDEDVRQGLLVRVLAEYQLPQAVMQLVYPPGPPLAAKTRALLDFMRAWFAEHGVGSD